MIYRVIGLMSGSSLDGLDIVFAELNEGGGQWSWSIEAAGCQPYDESWSRRLREATTLGAEDYLLLHAAYGRFLGESVLRFIDDHNLHYKVALIASHGHTTFHRPEAGMTGQLGCGAQLAAVTGLPVVSDLRALDVAFGGQGAPIVPMGERLLLPGYQYYLNLGGIANLSHNAEGSYTAYDLCPANRVLNELALEGGHPYDAGGALAATGTVNEGLLQALRGLPYYSAPAPKSLANSFGTDTVLPLVNASGLSLADRLCTYVEHVAEQVESAVGSRQPAVGEINGMGRELPAAGSRLLITGGGAFNTFQVARIRERLSPLGIEVVVPDDALVQYKEALIMGLLGVLRWRQEYTVLSTVTGAARASIGGALWNGQEA